MPEQDKDQLSFSTARSKPENYRLEHQFIEFKPNAIK